MPLSALVAWVLANDIVIVPAPGAHEYKSGKPLVNSVPLYAATSHDKTEVALTNELLIT